MVGSIDVKTEEEREKRNKSNMRALGVELSYLDEIIEGKNIGLLVLSIKRYSSFFEQVKDSLSASQKIDFMEIFYKKLKSTLKGEWNYTL